MGRILFIKRRIFVKNHKNNKRASKSGINSDLQRKGKC